MVAEIMVPAERDFRGPGCGADCRAIQALLPGVFGRSDLLLHDPDAHEEYGRRQAASTQLELVVTGRLSVDLLRWEVCVDGRPVDLTPTEHRLIRALAERAGCPREHRALLVAAWDTASWDNRHMLRVAMARLRGKLGPAATLIRTVSWLGYRLEMVAVGTTLGSQARNPGWPRRIDGWARDWACCRGCGSTETAHAGHGYCRRCRHRVSAATTSG